MAENVHPQILRELDNTGGDDLQIDRVGIEFTFGIKKNSQFFTSASQVRLVIGGGRTPDVNIRRLAIRLSAEDAGRTPDETYRRGLAQPLTQRVENRHKARTIDCHLTPPRHRPAGI